MMTPGFNVGMLSGAKSRYCGDEIIRIKKQFFYENPALQFIVTIKHLGI